MTEKEAVREGGPPPRSYSEFMRNLAAKYNGENPAEARVAAQDADPRLQSAPKPGSIGFPQTFPFPPFLFPNTTIGEGLKEPQFPFLHGLRPPLHPGLIDPGQAQALLAVMRAQAPPPAPTSRSAAPALDLGLSSRPPAAKRTRRSTSSADEPPVSPPASKGPNTCLSLCSTTQACSEEGKAVLAWNTEQVAEFVRSLPPCKEFADVFVAENIDGAVLALLTDTHLQGLGLKLGPALRLRAALAARLGNCPHCRHCKHCHQQE